MDMEEIDGLVCAASDLTARLHSELAHAHAKLAISRARVHSIVARGEALPKELITDSILAAELVAVLFEVLNGVPSVDDDAPLKSA